MGTNEMLRGQHSADSILLVALELSLKQWRLVMAPVGSVKRRVKVVEGGDYAGLATVVEEARERFGLAAGTRVIFCYEAGRDGFYPCRRLEQSGHTVWVVDSSSIEVNRRQRHAKSDGIDGEKLQVLMQRRAQGEERALKVVRVPSVAQEDERQAVRERDELRVECARLRTRMRALLFNQGWREFPESPREIGRWLEQHERQMPEGLRERLQREYERLLCAHGQFKAVEKALRQRRESTTDESSRIAQCAQQLARLRGIADVGADTLSAELFGWRHFRNRREVGACVGLTPTPYSSGDTVREQGISKAGSARVRRVATQLAWQWLRCQPQSELTQWYQERFAGAGRRARRIGIVALTRKLLVALWHYLEHGVVPQGARFKTA